VDKMGYNVTINSSKAKEKIAKLQKLRYKKLRVGFFEKGIAQIARWNNYGVIIPVTEKMRWFFIFNFHHAIGKDKTNIIIPPRPFMTLAFEKNKKDYAKRLKFGLKATKDADKAIDLLGVSIMQDIQTSISEGGWTPNAPLTIALKGKDTPLMWTGQMQKSVEYKVE